MTDMDFMCGFGCNNFKVGRMNRNVLDKNEIQIEKRDRFGKLIRYWILFYFIPIFQVPDSGEKNSHETVFFFIRPIWYEELNNAVSMEVPAEKKILLVRSPAAQMWFFRYSADFEPGRWNCKSILRSVGDIVVGRWWRFQRKYHAVCLLLTSYSEHHTHYSLDAKDIKLK